MNPATRILRATALAMALILVTACATQPTTESTEQFEQGKAAYLAGDYSTAFELLLSEAQAGNADAQYTIGYMYYQGQGVAEDEAAALRWIQRSAAGGNQRAVEALGQLAGMGGARQGLQSGGATRSSDDGAAPRAPENR